jgi:hypothetical protein
MNRFYQHFKSNPTEDNPFHGYYEVIGKTINEFNEIQIIYRPLYEKLKKGFIGFNQSLKRFAESKGVLQTAASFFGIYGRRFTKVTDSNMIKLLKMKSKELYGIPNHNN